MVNGARVTEIQKAYRPGHRFGNWLLTGMVAWIFGNRFSDMLSGYRVMSRRYVKSFPGAVGGFRNRNRIDRACAGTAHADRRNRHALQRQARRFGQQAQHLPRRVPHSVDDHRAGEGRTADAVFLAARVVLAAFSLALAMPILIEYVETGLVPRLPTAVLAMGLMILAFLSLTCGLILDTVTRGRREMKRMRLSEYSGAQFRPCGRAAALN